MKFSSIFTTACVALGLSATVASAGTVLNYTGHNVFGSGNLQQRVDVESHAPIVHINNVRAGAFDMTDAATHEQFLAFCFDLEQYVANGVHYNETDVLPAAYSRQLGGRTTELSQLFTGHFEDVDTALEGAAMQIAIWELTYETDSVLDVSIGNFVASDNIAAVALANTWLSSLDQYAAAYEFTFYTSATNQDLVRGTRIPGGGGPGPAPVPLPAGILLLGAGLGALGLTRKRSA